MGSCFPYFFRDLYFIIDEIELKSGELLIEMKLFLQFIFEDET